MARISAIDDGSWAATIITVLNHPHARILTAANFDQLKRYAEGYQDALLDTHDPRAKYPVI